MLVLKRKAGQWVEITHTATGEKVRVCVGRVLSCPTQVDLVFDDDARHFAIERPERLRPRETATAVPPAAAAG